MCTKKWIRILLVFGIHLASSWYDTSRLTARKTSIISIYLPVCTRESAVFPVDRLVVCTVLYPELLRRSRLAARSSFSALKRIVCFGDCCVVHLLFCCYWWFSLSPLVFFSFFFSVLMTLSLAYILLNCMQNTYFSCSLIDTFIFMD